MNSDIKKAIASFALFFLCILLAILLSGCFIVEARKRDQDRQQASTNLPPMTVTTNLFNAGPVPGFGDQ